MKQEKFDLSKKRYGAGLGWKYDEEDVKEFIRINWKNQCHFIWDLLRDLSDSKNLNLSDFWIEKQIQKLQEKQDKLTGSELTEQGAEK